MERWCRGRVEAMWRGDLGGWRCEGGVEAVWRRCGGGAASGARGGGSVSRALLSGHESRTECGHGERSRLQLLFKLGGVSLASNVWAVNCSLCPRILDSVETCLYDLVHSIKKCRSPCFSEVSGGALALPESDSELEDAASAATAQSGKYDERHFDERGVVGDVGKLIKRGLRLPGSPAAGTPVPRDHAGEVLGDANRANSVVGSFFGSASLSFGKSRSTSSAAAETPGGADRKSSYNSQSAPLEKTTRRLNLSTEEARSEVQRLIDLGVWRNYQPISIWPQVNEKAAASLIVKRWREKKGVRLRIARRRADEAFRGHGGASGETAADAFPATTHSVLERVASNA